jgi:hypothetical protein
VGADYEMLADALEEIPEATPEKEARLTEMRNGKTPDSYTAQARWIGEQPE